VKGHGSLILTRRQFGGDEPFNNLAQKTAGHLTFCRDMLFALPNFDTLGVVCKLGEVDDLAPSFIVVWYETVKLMCVCVCVCVCVCKHIHII
jgi:hypothetical protein